MRYLVISDIHGSYDDLLKVLAKKSKYNFDKIIILGDILYHGPRNDLPKGYAPKNVIKTLNELKDDIISVRGNCEAEVDQMVLNFKIRDNAIIYDFIEPYYLTHGHHLKFNNEDDEILNRKILYGHYHIPSVKEIGNHIYINVGSISLPKENNPKTFGILDEEGIKIYDFEDNLLFNV